MLRKTTMRLAEMGGVGINELAICSDHKGYLRCPMNDDLCNGGGLGFVVWRVVVNGSSHR
jgi:hypothetical protein